MVGLHLLKHLLNLSDETAYELWVENPYYQHFCGFAYFQHELPIDRAGARGSAPVGWRFYSRRRSRPRSRPVPSSTNDLKCVTVDTTVQPKAVAHPSDARLYHRDREILVRLAKSHGLTLRQSYHRLGKRALRKAGAYLHARQNNRATREIRRLKTYHGRGARDVTRKIAGHAALERRFAAILDRVGRVLVHQRHDRGKLYSLHAPEVECLAKGKAN
jgi:IS5 family transposase